MEENPYRSPLSHGDVERSAAHPEAMQNPLATGFKKVLWMGLAVLGTIACATGVGLALSTLEEFTSPKPHWLVLSMFPVGLGLFCLGIFILIQASKRLDFRVEKDSRAAQKESP